MIGALFIGLGLVGSWLAYAQFKDWRRSEGEFFPHEESTADRWWMLNTKLRRINSHLDLWIFMALAPICIVAGLVLMVRGE
ncbi:hypothetical protein [Erythrobacter sp.]|uniref:hypothetical protein n=1 Tax=Erythrobacter sp. TaxID=1042 RepID=UPI002600EB14|nr:hypothetical protein [Erythrobacter sp.]